jgi:UDP-N-acetylglucosamine/UDP-N-acetylgalactosamine diphosphorylase
VQGGESTSLAQKRAQLEERLEALARAGVVIVDPRQTFVGEDVDLSRIRAGVVLHPGARLTGARTFLGEGVQVGAEGPATLVDAVCAAGSRVASGFCNSAVLLEGASLGADAHVRAGTLLEEQASTAHAVGLKHTILLAFVTLGSVINFCDCLMAGGTSRRDHSEVGSGFIHFNFTPWGERGDKATPSLIGDVPRAVFYRESRIFLGGSGGMIGPRTVDYGAVAAAGQIVRHDIDEDRLVLRTPPRIDRRLDKRRIDGGARADKNHSYIAHLVALRAFYRQVRLRRASEAQRPVVDAAIETLSLAVDERVKRLTSFLHERGRDVPPLNLEPEIAEACPLPIEPGSAERESHLDYVAGLDSATCESGVAWLRGIVNAVEPPDAN